MYIAVQKSIYPTVIIFMRILIFESAGERTFTEEGVREGVRGVTEFPEKSPDKHPKNRYHILDQLNSRYS